MLALRPERLLTIFIAEVYVDGAIFAVVTIPVAVALRSAFFVLKHATIGVMDTWMDTQSTRDGYAIHT